jgi:hypothetical protein
MARFDFGEEEGRGKWAEKRAKGGKPLKNWELRVEK